MADWLASAVANRLTLTLLHFVWQGTLAGLVYWLLLTIGDVRSARVRYTAALVTLIAVAICPLVTFVWLDGFVSAPTNVATAHRAALPADGQTWQESGILTATKPSLAAAGLQPAGAGHSLLQSTLSRTRPYLLLVWLAGVLALSARLFAGALGTIWLRSGQSELPIEFARRSRTIARRMGLKTVRIRASVRVRQAAVVGFVRPVVLLPAAWLVSLPIDVLEAVVAHELAHLRRYDVWVNLLQRMVETLLFYHPVVWWLSSEVRREREMCCDELAVAVTGDRGRYALALERVGRLQVQGRMPLATAFTGEGRMNLLNRIQNVLSIEARPRRYGFRLMGPAPIVSLSAVATSLLLVGVLGHPTGQHVVVAQDRAEEPAAESPRSATAADETRPAEESPEPQPLPEELHGFRGMLLGRLVAKDVERGEFTVTVDYVPRVWRNNSAKQPRSAVGKTFRVDGVSGRFLDRLLLIEPGTTLRFEAQHQRDDRFTFPGELLEKAEPYVAADYPVPPDTFRGFRGIVVGTIESKREDQLELTLRIDRIEKVLDGNGARNAESGIGKPVVVAGFWREELRRSFESFKAGDTLRLGLHHQVPASDHLSVIETARKVDRDERESGETSKVELDDAGFPAGMHGFRGILSGRLVEKDIEAGTLTFVAGEATRVWKQNKATDLKSCEGHTFLVEGISGRWLDVLITLEKDDRLEVEAFHNGGAHLDFVQEWLKKVE